MKTRTKFAAVALAATLFTSSCLGPNKLFEGLRDWNQEATEQDWVNEVIFLGLTIIPVYSLAYLADIVVMNTIEYWGGDDSM